MGVLIKMANNPIGQNIVLYNDYSKIVPSKTNITLNMEGLLKQLRELIGKCLLRVEGGEGVEEWEEKVLEVLEMVSYFVVLMVSQAKTATGKNTHIQSDKRRAAMA